MSCNRAIANDGRLDGRGNEKDLRFDKAYGKDFKYNDKSDSHQSYSWRVARQGPYCDEDGKIHFAVDVNESFKGKDFTGDIDLDPKGEEKLKEKFIQRREDRCKDRREMGKDANNPKSNTQLSVFCNEKNVVGDEREVNWWSRVMSNIQKENEAGEKNSIKKEIPDMGGLEYSNHEKHIDRLEKVLKQAMLALEPRKLKDDVLEDFDDEVRGMKRDNDVQFDCEMHEARDCHIKETEKGSDGDGSKEKGSEPPCNGFQQFKRTRRFRHSLSNSNQEPHFISETSDQEGIQGNAQIGALFYKPGESMPELLKLWQEFEASSENSNGDDVPPFGPILDIRIPSQHVSSTNHKLRYAHMWGTDVYTIDSDVVAVLIHTGYCCPLLSPLPAAIDELRATIRVLPPQDCYLSTIRNNIHSRSWGSSTQCSYRIESCCIVKKGGESIKLEPHLTRISGLEPTIAPLPDERTMLTRAAASNSNYRQRFVREVSVHYNLCNEPWIKYRVSVVADKGMRKPLYTSTRLKKGEVLYVETHFNRYELCFNGEKTCNGSQTSAFSDHASHFLASDRSATDIERTVDVFRWSRCKKAYPEQVMRSVGIPLPLEHLEVVEENLDWEDIQWSHIGVWIAGKEYQLARVHFVSPK